MFQPQTTSPKAHVNVEIHESVSVIDIVRPFTVDCHPKAYPSELFSDVPLTNGAKGFRYPTMADGSGLDGLQGWFYVSPRVVAQTSLDRPRRDPDSGVQQRGRIGLGAWHPIASF